MFVWIICIDECLLDPMIKFDDKSNKSIKMVNSLSK